MNLPWIDLAIGASCALLSAIVARTILAGFRPNHLVFVLIWIFLFPIMLVAAFVFVKPEVQVWRARTLAAAMIEGDPLFAVLSSRHSEVSAEIHKVMTESVKRGLSGEDARRMAFTQSAGFLMSFIDPYLQQGGDKEVVDYAAQLLRVVRTVKTGSGVRCYWLLTGSPAPDGSTFSGVPGVEISDLSQKMAIVVRSAVRNPREPASREEVEAYIEELERRFAARFGEDVSEQLGILNRPARDDAERELVCRFLLELYEEAFQMPAEHRGNALRTLMINW